MINLFTLTLSEAQLQLNAKLRTFANGGQALEVPDILFMTPPHTLCQWLVQQNLTAESQVLESAELLQVSSLPGAKNQLRYRQSGVESWMEADAVIWTTGE